MMAICVNSGYVTLISGFVVRVSWRYGYLLTFKVITINNNLYFSLDGLEEGIEIHLQENNEQ